MSIEEIINQLIVETKADTNKISDGYHTFEGLYAHRIALFIVLCRLLPNQSWKSRKHSDGSQWEGWFIAGINYLPGEQISYHLPDSKWDALDIHELRQAPPYDGHSPDDVLERLLKL